MKRLITSGIHTYPGTEYFVFDFSSDSNQDVINLCRSSSESVTVNGVEVICGYRYDDTSSQPLRNIFRNQLKYHPNDSRYFYEDDLEEFVNLGIRAIENYHPLASFDVIASVKSDAAKNPLLDILHGYMMEYTSNLYCDVQLIKETCDHVTFDADKARVALMQSDRYFTTRRIDSIISSVLQQFQECKESKCLFKMKSFMPREIREGFENFLKFNSEDEAHLYAALQGANVLIYDDFMTSGTTLREISRCLNSINPTNHLVSFVLIKQ